MAPTRKGLKKGSNAPAPTKKAAQGSSFVKADWKEGFKKKQVGVSDMTLLSVISNDSINENLKKRFENAEIYTYIGHVLISVNPFRMLPIYSDETLHSYRGKNRLEMSPHVYAIAESAYYQMISYKENQCVIISGESGAGKTEAAKRIMQYIAAVAGGEGIDGVKEMVLATNPLLESFGCAKTLRNNNSSRHGKYLEIEFDAQGGPVGAVITNYLLEKNRVTGQIENERNFHIFYQLTKGASSAQREAYGLQGPDAYAYTSKSNCLDVPGIDDKIDWNETLAAMNVIGISPEDQDEILRNLATVLWLGNVTFSEGDDGNAVIVDESVPAFVAYLMEVDPATMNKVLTSRVVETQRGGKRGSVYEVPLNPAQASSVRDALAKAIYNNLFDWIVARVNVSMKARAPTSHIIGVLDIYGFEIFDTNQFEQLCINYVNEKLQQIFIQLTLKTEQEEYVREQIKWTPINYFNNQIVCDLIEEKRPPGIFAALNDACATAHADPTAADGSFSQRLGGVSNTQFEPRGSKFLIRHYAGEVMYTVAGMTDKNKDVLLKDLLDLVDSSSNVFLQGLFPDRPDPNSKKRPPTASDKIKSSANALVEKLMRSQPSYIRTIKPNQNKSPFEYDTKAILHQIKYLGLQENIRVRRAGFAYRNTFEKMVERFYLLSPATSYAGEYIWQGDAKTGCERILRDTGIAKEEWQMGTTKAFIKNPETLFALEHMRDRYWHNMAGRIQRAWRNYMRYKNECATRIQRFWTSKKDGIVLSQLRDYGHTVLAGRKERRRFSLLSMRRFTGDYLGVGDKSANGEYLRGAAVIGPSEAIAFSARIQLLVSKLGRSSKPSPRYFILTDKAAYILISQNVGGRAQTSLERKIPLVTIKSVGLSNLRDDWIAVNVSNSEEADPVFSCFFKTELVVHLLQRTNGGVDVKIGPTIEYQKKKDKLAQITFKKDEMVKKDDVYKSSTVSVCTGEPANSISMPPARRKPGAIRPIANGKLLRSGGPSNTASKPAARPMPKSQILPSGASSSIPKAPAAISSTARAVPTIPKASNGRAPPPPSAAGAGPGRTAPPPPSRAPLPPPPPPEPEVEMYKALFAFETDQAGEMALAKDELVEIAQKDEAGWWLVKKGGAEGWAPSNYLQLVPPKPKAAPAPAPAPPSRRALPPPAPSSNTTPSQAQPKQFSRAAESSAQPVSVMPGMGNGAGGLQAILAAKRAAAAAEEGGASSENSSPNGSRPSSGLAKPLAPKPKPKPPVVGTKPKPSAPVPPSRPHVAPAPPSRPNAAPAPPSRPNGGAAPATPAGGGRVLGGGEAKPPGQLDLAAALAKRAGRMQGQ